MDQITDQDAPRFVCSIKNDVSVDFLGITCIEPFSEVFLSSILTSMAINWWFPEIPRLLFFFSNIFCWFWADFLLISAINVSNGHPIYSNFFKLIISGQNSKCTFLQSALLLADTRKLNYLYFNNCII